VVHDFNFLRRQLRAQTRILGFHSAIFFCTVTSAPAMSGLGESGYDVCDQFTSQASMVEQNGALRLGLVALVDSPLDQGGTFSTSGRAPQFDALLRAGIEQETGRRDRSRSSSPA